MRTIIGALLIAATWVGIADAQTYYVRQKIGSGGPMAPFKAKTKATCTAPDTTKAANGSGNALPSNSLPYDAARRWVDAAMAICEGETYGGTGNNVCGAYRLSGSSSVTVVRYRSGGASIVAIPSGVVGFAVRCTDNP